MSRVRIGHRAIDDQQLEQTLDTVRREIKRWATRRGLWYDAAFHLPHEHYNNCPKRGEVILLSYEGPLYNVFTLGDGPALRKYEEQFAEMLKGLGFWYELQDNVTMSIFPADETALDDYLTLQRWRWLQHLAAIRLFDIHAEVFQHFAVNPGRLQSLSWRQFEETLDAIFRNQGFYTELGPGRADGLVDLRLYQSRAIPELVAVVQAKRWTRRPIGLESVAALFGVAAEQRAPRGIFATTSRFLPVAKRFAQTTQTRLDLPSIELADAERISEWCGDIARRLGDFFSGGAGVAQRFTDATATLLAGRIVVAHHGCNTLSNCFAVIEIDFPHEVVLRPIGNEIVSGDGQVGTEIASDGAPARWTEAARFGAFKEYAPNSAEKMSFWGDRKLFSLWDGTPQYFSTAN